MIVILFVSTTFTSCYYKWENQYLLMRISIPIPDKNNSSSREVIKISVAPYIIFKNINIQEMFKHVAIQKFWSLNGYH